jgi:methionyl-tRNA formyltransferase
MHIVLLCATDRGLQFLGKLVAMLPAGARLTVVSFREEPVEPPFLDAVKSAATSAGARFFETRNVAGPRMADFWASEDADLMFAVSWRYMIPVEVYERPKFGTYVFHDSLLPAYRGFAPTVWAIANGEDHTGVTLFRISEEVDAGDVVAQRRIAIGPDDAISTVMPAVTKTYLQLLDENLVALASGTAKATPQNHAAASYTCKRLPGDNTIDWAASTARIHNLIRAVSRPYSGATTSLASHALTVWAAERVADAKPYVGRVPGRVVAVLPGKGSIVLTGDGAVLLTRVQAEGGEEKCAADVLDSISMTLGR